MSWRALWICLCLSALAYPPPSAAQDDEDELGLDEEESPAAGETAEETSAAEGEGEAEGETPAEGEATEDAEAPAPTREMTARAFFGGGFGTRSFRRPIAGGAQRLSDVYFAAADIGIGVRLWPEEAFSLDFLIRYQTSLGLVIEEQPMFALVNKVDLRSEHAELSVAPRFQLGSSPAGAWLGLPIGISMRNFFPVNHQLLTPRYTLFGPHARVELDFALGDLVRVRLGPEAQFFFVTGTDLLDAGVSGTGLALGGEVGVQIQFADHFALELELRQSWARAPSSNEPSFLDTERFVTARLAGEM